MSRIEAELAGDSVSGFSPHFRRANLAQGKILKSPVGE